ncbi:MAG: PDZ domain-containing protein, partial [Clostridia bacterium]|nr:PDZ domain-containing protein [Clostridia bacterium]
FDGYYNVLYVYDPGTNESFAQGDYIYAIDGTVVKTVEAFYEIILSHSVGDTVSVVIVRNGTQKTVSVTLEEYIPS